MNQESNLKEIIVNIINKKDPVKIEVIITEEKCSYLEFIKYSNYHLLTEKNEKIHSIDNHDTKSVNKNKYKKLIEQFKKLEKIGRLIGYLYLIKMYHEDYILAIIRTEEEITNENYLDDCIYWIRLDSQVLLDIMNDMIIKSGNINNISILTWIKLN